MIVMGIYINAPLITNLQEAKKFISECVDYIGLGFHPDTPFIEYIELTRGETLYSEKSAKEADERLNTATEFFDIANEDIYKYVLSLF